MGICHRLRDFCLRNTRSRAWSRLKHNTQRLPLSLVCSNKCTCFGTLATGELELTSYCSFRTNVGYKIFRARWLETKDFSLARAGEPEPRAKDTLGWDRLFIHVAWVNRQLSGIIFQCCVTRSEWADDKHVFAQGKGIFFIFNLTTRIKRSFPVYQEREKSTSWQKWKKSLSPRKNKQQHQ